VCFVLKSPLFKAAEAIKKNKILSLLQITFIDMVVHSFYVINRSGGLIFSYEHSIPKIELEKTFSYPLDFVLKPGQKGTVVEFGQRDGIKVGHTILSINGIPVRGNFIDFSAPATINNDDEQQTPSSTSSRDIGEYLSDSTNYPGMTNILY
jgi:hypothetical protein